MRPIGANGSNKGYPLPAAVLHHMIIPKSWVIGMMITMTMTLTLMLPE